MHMAQQLSATHSSRGKGTSFEECLYQDDESLVPELRKQIGVLNHKLIKKDLVISQHSSRIADLEATNAQLTIRIDDLEADKSLRN